jgi:beta-lactamase regulating signal transducer with metallopeptidase domain
MNPLTYAFTPAGLTVMFVDFVVNALWMGAVIAVLTALILRVWEPLDAAARYAVWYAALIAIAIAPVVVAVLQRLHAPLVMIVSIDERPGSHATFSSGAIPPLPVLHGIPLPQAVAFAAVALWFVVSTIGVVRILAGAIELTRLKRDALPLSPALRDGLSLWRARVAASAVRSRLCVSDRVDVPVAVGLFDRMVVVPDHVLGAFEPGDIDRFILHELAHLERRDDWTALLQRVVQTMQFFNPAVYFIARRLDLEREIACDDRVVEATHDVRSYAVGLTRMAESTAWPHRGLATPAIFVTRKQLSLRVEVLLGRRRSVAPGVALAPAIVAFTAAACVVAAASPLSPSFSLGGTRAAVSEDAVKKFLLAGQPPLLSPPWKKRTYVYLRQEIHHVGAPVTGKPPLTDAQLRTLVQSIEALK